MGNGSTGTCKDCQGPIKWQERNGKWTPLDPRTGERHRCQIDRIREVAGCGKKFKGAPWMRACPEGYKRDSGRGSNAPREPARAPRTKERLEPGRDDDVPF